MSIRVVKIGKNAIEKGVLVNLIINNRAGGKAPLIAQEIAEQLKPETPPKSNGQLHPWQHFIPSEADFPIFTLLLLRFPTSGGIIINHTPAIQGSHRALHMLVIGGCSNDDEEAQPLAKIINWKLLSLFRKGEFSAASL